MKKRTVKALEICLVCCCSPCGTNCTYGFFDAIFVIVLVVAVAAVVCVSSSVGVVVFVAVIIAICFLSLVVFLVAGNSVPAVQRNN